MEFVVDAAEVDADGFDAEVEAITAQNVVTIVGKKSPGVTTTATGVTEDANNPSDNNAPDSTTPTPTQVRNSNAQPPGGV